MQGGYQLQFHRINHFYFVHTQYTVEDDNVVIIVLGFFFF